MLLEAIWFLLPAGVANVVPVLATRMLPSLSLPVDFGLKLAGRPIAGSHKTWRGLTTGVAAAGAVFALQQYTVAADLPLVRSLSVIDYVGSSWLVGVEMGLAALLGDLLKSVAKRRVGIAPGRSWFPFDQIDWLLGTAAFAMLAFDLPNVFLISVVAVGIALHLITHYLGYLLGLNATRI